MIATGMASENSPRGLIVRPGLGAVGRVIQRARLTSHRITPDLATLVLVEAGTKAATWAGATYTASKGDALALQPGLPFDLTNTPDADGSYRAFWISWSTELVEGGASRGSGTGPVTLLKHLDDGFHQAYRAAFESLSAVSTVPAPIAEHRLREVLLWLEECGVRFPRQDESRFSTRLRVLFTEEPGKAWSAEEVAHRLHSSAPTLRRRLAEEDASFREVLTDVRMCRALTLLQNTDDSVLTIANAVGYESPSRFTARFRVRFGFLPSDVRGGEKEMATGSTFKNFRKRNR